MSAHVQARLFVWCDPSRMRWGQEDQAFVDELERRPPSSWSEEEHARWCELDRVAEEWDAWPARPVSE